jgi:HEPN pEK499 p136
MEYTNFIVDFARRTLLNLDYMQAQADRGVEDVYPVTQLWNSLLGLVVLPRELDVNSLPETSMLQLRTEGWPQFPTTAGEEPRTVRDLVTHLRHAVAHFNVEFNTGPERAITSLTIWSQATKNGRPIKGSRGWEGRITVEDLNRLARRIADLYVKEFATTAA